MSRKLMLLSRTALVALCGVAAGSGFANAGNPVRSGLSGPAAVEFSTIGTTEARLDIDVGFFFNELQPHGRWVRHNRYNYVFVPDDVDDDWAPYTEGHWVYTRQYGWTWVSDESFGWATYHYGRWAYDRDIGWYWVPGTKWAPAWVSWRRGRDHIGWAPLPPERDGFAVSIQIGASEIPEDRWFFVRSSAFLERDLDRVIVRSTGRNRYYNDTELVGPVVVQNNTVINNVINVTYIEEQTNKKVVVHEVAESDSPDDADREDGRTVKVFAPDVAEPTGDKAPQKVVELEEVKKERKARRDQAGVKDADTEAGEQQTEAKSGTEADADAKATAKSETDADVKKNADNKAAEADADADAKAGTTAESAAGDAKRKGKAKAEAKADGKANAGAKTKAAETADTKRKKVKGDAASKAKAETNANVKAETDAGDVKAKGKAKSEAKKTVAPEAGSKAAVTGKAKRKPAEAAKAPEDLKTPKAAKRAADQPANQKKAEKPGKKKKQQAAEKAEVNANDCTAEAKAAERC